MQRVISAIHASEAGSTVMRMVAGALMLRPHDSRH